MAELSDKEKIIWFVCFVVEGVVIIFCNVTAIVIFARKTHQSRSCILLVNQSVVDLLVGAQVLYFSLQYISIISPISRNLGNTGCRTVNETVKMVLWNYAIDLSLTTLSFISLERVFAVFKPFRHRVLRTRTYYYAVLYIWVMCSWPSVVIVIFRCDSIQDVLSFGASMASLLLSLVTILVAYSSIYIKLKFYPTMQLNCQTPRQIKLCRTLFYASAASMLTVLPSSVEKAFWQIQSGHARGKIPNLSGITMWLLFSNSFVNFFIYYWRFPEFNDDLKKLFRWKRAIVNEAVGMERREPTPQTGQ